MHEQVITDEQFAMIQGELEVFGRVNGARAHTTIGKHPTLGACVLLAAVRSDPMLLSEAPFNAAGSICRYGSLAPQASPAGLRMN